MKKILMIFAVIALSCCKQPLLSLSSPDKHIDVHFSQQKDGTIHYTIHRDGKVIQKIIGPKNWAAPDAIAELQKLL